MNGKNLNKSIV